MYPLVCIDCRWCLPTAASESSGVYQCKASEKTNLVTGKPEYQYCTVMRLRGEPCDIEGKLFSLNIPDQLENNHGE